MPPVLLFKETYDGEVGVIDLEDRTPVPGPGSAAEYKVGGSRYRVHPGGYADANGVTASVARYPDWLIPVNTRFRLVLDVFREGVDFVGGGLTGRAFVPSEDINTWDFLDNITCEIRRNSLLLTDARMTWKKDPSEPPPAEVVMAFAGSIQQGPNEGVRYEFEVDEVNRIVRIFIGEFGLDRPLFGLAGDIPPVAEGVLSDELAAHLAADRLVGFDTSRAAFGLVPFRLYNLEIWDMGTPTPPVTGPPCKCQLTVYADDRVTPLWEVSTDPNHARPYLVEPDHYGEQQIDVATGAASLSEVVATVIDLAQIIGDQESGYVTALLAAIGVPDLAGHRNRFLRFDPNGDPVIIVDGPAGAPRLNPDYSSFSWPVRDTRETETKIRCFDLIGTQAPAIEGATPAGPEQTGTDPGFTWGTEYH